MTTVSQHELVPIEMEEFGVSLASQPYFSLAFSAQENLQHFMNAEILGQNIAGSGLGRYRTCDQKVTGLPCNPHTFRRTFACLLRKAGVDTMTIKDLGRWESLEMVQRYTRSVNFQDSLKFYKAPLSL